MPLCVEVGVGLGHVVLDQDQALPKKGHSRPPLFDPCLLWPNGRPSQLLIVFVYNNTRNNIIYNAHSVILGKTRNVDACEVGVVVAVQRCSFH